ncbi:phospholipase D-like domain-containing protein [Pseudomonas sp. S9]|uniref:phospholipase D-like domain-containing protein n=1 Tax=Pseudomonas sp. S9 TaxID=686578 RepID=UPI0002556C60|nr:phospholipase D-like domain-containing protein [Pseudomonas sp. S9]
MATNPAYNGVRAKELSQINTQDGKALIAYSAPDYFLKGQGLFAPKRTGNEVKFFTTGEDYFKNLASAIDQATQSIFITGWQVNYDVLLDGKRSLWQCLYQALTRSTSLKVYVMPWLSPNSAMGTYDFETMLTIFQLNAGLAGGPRAFCTPAIQQSDMKGLGVAFSHHQKSVVIDNKIGYVGGIDLAYGRRDDNNFSLDASTRKGNDAYNPGLPKLGWMRLQDHVSADGLMLATLFDLSKPTAIVLNSANYPLDFIKSPALSWIQYIGRALESASQGIDQVTDSIAQAKRELLEKTCKAVAQLIRDNLETQALDQSFKARLVSWLDELQLAGNNMTESLRIKSTVLINEWMSTTELGHVVKIISKGTFEDLPGDVMSNVNELASSVLWSIYGMLQNQAWGNKQPYYYLNYNAQPLASPNNTTLDADQPRMPWQDVHSRIEGPSVYDLSRNFIDRWNGQQAYIADTPPIQNTEVVNKALKAIMVWLNRLIKGVNLEHYLNADDLQNIKFSKPEPVYIKAQDQLPQPPVAKPAGVSVQVLRSASARMTQQEQHGRSIAGVNLPLPPGIDTGGMQANCKSAMEQAISSAQQFIYIENQFFQSAYGTEQELFPGIKLSGPMASLRDPMTLPQNLVARVRLREALEAEDIWQLNWQEISSIAQDPSAEAKQFLTDMWAIFNSNATGWVTQKLGEQQSGLLNDIGQSLVNRIGRAIDEELPFHVYLVLPVHPEGTLNTLNIMHQVSLTMQSLVFGEHSLVKGIQRRMALHEQMQRGRTKAEALEGIEVKNTKDRPVYEQQDRSQYLTLLNLRNWDTLNGRVVTEQIYIHSKLLIADDRVAILGSANINDRSLQGNRDSELAVIVRDSAPGQAKLDGKNAVPVSKAVQQLRIDLWKKHFGPSLTKKCSIKPADELKKYLEQPAVEDTWRAIQARSSKNTAIYNQSFTFIPQNTSQLQPLVSPLMKGYENGFPTPVWPTWIYKSPDGRGELYEPMPYEEAFWRSTSLTPVKNFSPPIGVQGFICALPTNWTRGENNDSGINLTVLAKNQKQQGLEHDASLAMTTNSKNDKGQRT